MLKKLTALYALITTACASWQKQPPPVPRVVAEESHGRYPHVRVELTSGQRYDIYTPSVVGDSIIGLSKPASDSKAERIAVATSDVKNIERQKFSGGRTLVAVLAITVAVAAIVGAAASSSSSSSSNSSCSSSGA
jgi:hypothetical protein